jgi:hypothetical protein
MLADNGFMISGALFGAGGRVIVLVAICGLAQTGIGQDTSAGKSWSTTSEQTDPNGVMNPTRTHTTHTEVDGRIVDKTITETLGPDGRYVPYTEVEKESVRVNDTTMRNVERSYARDADGRRTLMQETQEESRKLPDGERRVTSTTSNPDGNGALQVVQRSIMDSKLVSPGVRNTKTAIESADGSGGLSPTLQIEEKEKQTDATTVEFSKSTSFVDGNGRWTLSEVREGTTTKDAGGESTKDERVLRPNADGKMAVVERTVSKSAPTGSGEQRETTETYSTNVPGQAGDEGLKLVKRESTLRRSGAGADRSMTRQVEQTNPGDPAAGLQVTQETIDIVRTGANGVTQQQSTIVTTDANGSMNTVWVDMGKSDKPAAVPVNNTPAKKSKQ